MFSRLSPVYKGIVLALAGYSAFSVADISVKWLTDYYSNAQILAMENVGAALVLLLFAGKLGGFSDLKDPRNLKIHLLRGLLNAGLAFLLIYCYKHFPLADIYAMLFTKPFFAAVIAMVLYKETITRNRWLAIFIGFMGVLVAMRPGASDFNPMMIMPLCAASLIALMYVCGRSLHDPTPFSLAFIPIAVTVAITAPAAAFDFAPIQVVHIPVFILLGIAATLGYLLVSLAYRMAEASAVGPFVYIQMIWALVFGWLLFQDYPDTLMLVGAGIIIASGLYLVHSERSGKRLLP